MSDEGWSHLGEARAKHASDVSQTCSNYTPLRAVKESLVANAHCAFRGESRRSDRSGGRRGVDASHG